MKTKARSRTESRSRIDRLLDALRIQADHLQELAAKTRDRDEPDVEAADDPPPRVSLR